MKQRSFMSGVRKWSRDIHRDLSFLFAGVIVIYAVSGIALNHKKDFNSDYIIKREQVQLSGSFPIQQQISKQEVIELLAQVHEQNEYTKHYSPFPDQLKVFIKGGSSLVVNTVTGEAVYESIKKRPILSQFNRLHYNPGKWWTIFSDTFAVSLIIITLTGLLMLKGKKGFLGRGGIEFAAGILIPLIFLFLS